MLAFLVVAPLGLIILAAVAVAVALWLGRRGVLHVGRRPRPRHIVVRVVCGVLGAAILGAIAVGTWREVQRCYAPAEPAPALTVRVPALALPEPPASLKRYEEREIGKARLLFTLVMAELGTRELRPLAVGQEEFHWPEDKDRHVRKELKVGDSSAHFEFVVTGLHWVKWPSERPGGWAKWPSEGASSAPGDETFVVCRGSYEFSCQRWGENSGQAGDGGFGLNRIWQGSLRGYQREKQPLSIAYGPDLDPMIILFVFGTCVAEGDPLREVPAGELLHQREAEAREGARLDLGRIFLTADLGGVPARGLALATHIGVSSLLLLVAAVLLTQLFARRSLAFVGVLAATVLYVAILDRVALGTHVKYLRDGETPLIARVNGCRYATDTFFYKRTALAGVRAVADDPQAAPALRDVAQRAALVLSAARR